MQITGENLVLVRQGLVDALAEVHNQIATCPDVTFYESSIDELYVYRIHYERLLARVEASLKKEGYTL